MESVSDHCFHAPGVHLDNLDLVAWESIMVYAMIKTVHNDAKTPLVVSLEVFHVLHWWVVGHLQHEFTLFDVVRYQHAYDFRIINKVEHS